MKSCNLTLVLVLAIPLSGHANPRGGAKARTDSRVTEKTKPRPQRLRNSNRNYRKLWLAHQVELYRSGKLEMQPTPARLRKQIASKRKELRAAEQVFANISATYKSLKRSAPRSAKRYSTEKKWIQAEHRVGTLAAELEHLESSVPDAKTYAEIKRETKKRGQDGSKK